MKEGGINFVVGLGNPGKDYEKTRHNIGFMVVDEVAKACSMSLEKSKFDGLLGKGRIFSRQIILLKPMTFMNRSGNSVARVLDYFGLDSANMLVIYDDLDLEFGKIRIKEKGGHGGHNGMRSIISSVGISEFPRIRIGIGRPSGEKDVTAHVLGGFSKEEKKTLDDLILLAKDAVMATLEDDLNYAMNRFN